MNGSQNERFFYHQYDRIDWEKQKDTGLNLGVNEELLRIIKERHRHSALYLFDIGYGIGFFLQMCCEEISDDYESIHIEGDEPSKQNYEYYEANRSVPDDITVQTHRQPFLETKTDKSFDVLTSTYVFTHLTQDQLQPAAQKIQEMLRPGGTFLLTVANEAYLQQKLRDDEDLLIQTNKLCLSGETYEEYLHYTEIPEIGNVVDLNREEGFYKHLFEESGLRLCRKEVVDDDGFIASIFIFENTS